VPLKGTIKGLSVLELAEEQQRNVHGGGFGSGRRDSGILMEKTDINILKDPESAIKLKSSSKK